MTVIEARVVSFRLSTILLQRLDKAVERLSHNTRYATRGNFNRSDLMREALIRGLEIIEKEENLTD
ncbi:MAG: hypothetical protein BWK78_08730 [Thiotrichaceae bacterium IS1]|nr:MAG: hypothetical protein BWK78_08730 [Thiotrichaceae bacterium IS1]